MTSSATNIRQFVFFCLAAGLNTCFGYVAFAIFFWISASNDIGVLLGAIVAILFNFATYKAAFSAQGYARLPHFISFYAVLLIANVLLLRALVASGINPY